MLPLESLPRHSLLNPEVFDLVVYWLRLVAAAWGVTLGVLQCILFTASVSPFQSAHPVLFLM